MSVHEENEGGLPTETKAYEEQVPKELLELIERLARKYCTITGRLDLLDDLKSEGNKALMEGREKDWKQFDSSRGVKFGSFVFLRVRGAMLDYLHKERRAGMTGISRENYGQAKAVMRVHDELAEKKGRKPTVEEIANRMGITCAQVEKALELISMSLVSIEGSMESEGDEGSSRWDLPGQDPSAEEMLSTEQQKRAVKKTVDEALGRIHPDRRRVIELRIYEDLEYKEIGNILGRSSDSVRKLYERGMKDLRKILAPPMAAVERSQFGGDCNG